MHSKTKAALLDLQAVRDVAEVTPNRLQTWQTAARDLVAPPAPVVPDGDDTPEADA